MKNDLLQRMCRFFPPPEFSVGLLLGDFNFSAVSDYKYVGTTGLTVPVHDGTSTCFGNIVCTFIELVQDDYTWSRSRSFSRLDRIYTNIRASDLVDLRPSTSTVWSWSSPSANASDHLPNTSWFPAASVLQSGDKRVQYPNWVAHHPSFPDAILSIIKNSRGLDDDPIVAHRESKEILCTASDVVMQRLKDAPPSIISQEIYLILIAYRHSKRLEHDKYLRVAKQIPALLQFYRDLRYSYSELHDFLASKIIL
jgi:tRNA threonylcarbamoyladenosine modification (KEOPS) complex  Pcc1 subunit